MGHIRWSALSVNKAMDEVATQIEAIFEPLWRADRMMKEAMEIPNLPDYMKSSLIGVEAEIHNITGYDLQRHGSRLLNSIARVRRDIPEGSIEAEQNATKHGKTEKLFA